MDEIIKEMQGLKKDIDQSTLDAANVQGRLSSSLERLKKEFKQPSLIAAEKKINKNKEVMQSLSEEAVEKFSKLKEEYEF